MSKKVDKKEDTQTLRNLEKLGLSEKEARVYVALLSMGNVGSSKVVYATGLHGQFVYNALNHLEEIGLVRHTIFKGRKKFSANPPARLRFLIEEKRLLAESLVHTLAQKFLSRPEHVVELYEGPEAFIAHQYELLEDGEKDSFIDVIGGGGEQFWNIFGTELKKFDTARVARGISVRYLGSQEQFEKFQKETSKFGKFEFRPFLGLTRGAVDTQIRPASVTFALYQEPITLITVKNKIVAERQREFFETLWGIAQQKHTAF